MVLFPFKTIKTAAVNEQQKEQQRSKRPFMMQHNAPPSPKTPALKLSYRAASSVWDESMTPMSREGSIFYPSQAELGIGRETQTVEEEGDSDQWITIHPMGANNTMWLGSIEGPKHRNRWRFLGILATGIATLCLSLTGLYKK